MVWIIWPAPAPTSWKSMAAGLKASMHVEFSKLYPHERLGSFMGVSKRTSICINIIATLPVTIVTLLKHLRLTAFIHVAEIWQINNVLSLGHRKSITVVLKQDWRQQNLKVPRFKVRLNSTHLVDNTGRPLVIGWQRTSHRSTTWRCNPEGWCLVGYFIWQKKKLEKRKKSRQGETRGAKASVWQFTVYNNLTDTKPTIINWHYYQGPVNENRVGEMTGNPSRVLVAKLHIANLGCHRDRLTRWETKYTIC